MNYLLVMGQDELQEALLLDTVPVIIHPGVYRVEGEEGNPARVEVRYQPHFQGGKVHLLARGHTVVEAHHNATVVAFGHSRVTAHAGVFVLAMDDVHVEALAGAVVHLSDRATASAHPGALVQHLPTFDPELRVITLHPGAGVSRSAS